MAPQSTWLDAVARINSKRCCARFWAVRIAPCIAARSCGAINCRTPPHSDKTQCTKLCSQQGDHNSTRLFTLQEFWWNGEHAGNISCRAAKRVVVNNVTIANRVVQECILTRSCVSRYGVFEKSIAFSDCNAKHYPNPLHAGYGVIPCRF